LFMTNSRFYGALGFLVVECLDTFNVTILDSGYAVFAGRATHFGATPVSL